MNSPVKLSKTAAPLRAYGTNFKKTAAEATVEKFKEKCHYCKKNGHKSDVCHNKLKNYKALVNLAEEDLCTVVTDVNMVESNPKEWWYNA